MVKKVFKFGLSKFIHGEIYCQPGFIWIFQNNIAAGILTKKITELEIIIL